MLDVRLYAQRCLGETYAGQELETRLCIAAELVACACFIAAGKFTADPFEIFELSCDVIDGLREELPSKQAKFHRTKGRTMKTALTPEDVAIAYAAGYAVAQTSNISLPKALCDYLQRTCGLSHSDAEYAAIQATTRVVVALYKTGK